MVKPKGQRLTLNSKEPTLPLRDFQYNETRFSILDRQNQEHAEHLLDGTREGAHNHWERLVALKAL